MGKIPKNLKEVGIERCANASDVKIIWHPASIKMWLTIVMMVIAVSASGFKGFDWVWYGFLGNPRNNQELLMDHFTLHHLLLGDKPITDDKIMLKDKKSKVTVQEFQDKCVGTCYVNEYGMPIGYTLHSPDIDRIKNMMSIKFGIPEAFASEAPDSHFTMGIHANDSDYEYERWYTKSGIEYRLTFTDGCALRYYVDRKDGLSKGWFWEVYRH